ncbi:Trans-2,3-dihydro-3-hydroxyanthranilate isomerase [Fusarium oxysporum f. sp. albedinis]|nr:Trans-2,3-dihydro-3-hydroxyanthranilate isomerase [Fusarium oxysporum f. sp. albedinis]
MGCGVLDNHQSLPHPCCPLFALQRLQAAILTCRVTRQTAPVRLSLGVTLDVSAASALRYNTQSYLACTS